MIVAAIKVAKIATGESVGVTRGGVSLTNFAMEKWVGGRGAEWAAVVRLA